jgi:hypothetical protein
MVARKQTERTLTLRDLKVAIEKAEIAGLRDDAQVVVRDHRGPRWLWRNVGVETAAAGWINPVDPPVLLVVTHRRAFSKTVRYNDQSSRPIE